jgi:hypothetical protein
MPIFLILALVPFFNSNEHPFPRLQSGLLRIKTRTR